MKLNVPWWLQGGYLGEGTNCRDFARELYAAAFESYLGTGRHATSAYDFMESFAGLACLP
jgi:hypothetical protein